MLFRGRSRPRRGPRNARAPPWILCTASPGTLEGMATSSRANAPLQEEFMFKATSITVVAAGICAFLLPVMGGAKRQVERPWRIQGNMTVVLDLSTMTWVSEDWGEATHMGRYASHGEGYVLDPYLANGEGVGVNTVANGAEVFWEMVAENGIWTVSFVGGTDRFKDAAGSFIPAIGEMVIIPDDPVFPTQITYIFTYTGSGTITY